MVTMVNMFFCLIAIVISQFQYEGSDKVWMYEEIITNDDNLESNLLASS